MTLNQIAKQAMDYLDSVGVAADCFTYNNQLTVYTDDFTFVHYSNKDESIFINEIKRMYPQKSPA